VDAPFPSSHASISGTVVISGGLGGLGRAMALQALTYGASVRLLGRRTPSDAATDVAELGYPERVSYVQADAADAAAVDAAFADLDNLTAVIANAGVNQTAPFLQIRATDWDEIMRVNVTGTFLFCHAAARRLVSLSHGGVIVIVGSWVQSVPDQDNAAYCTSKAAIEMLGRCMALELAEYGIRVNTLAPGIVDAGMAKRRIDADPAFARQASTAIPLNRLQTPQEVARLALWLSSSEALYITGTTLLADGGAHLAR
jgi:NAD(P)-dependent dehydrogenase (short-subunit alcohol dehydrogenase family)